MKRPTKIVVAIGLSMLNFDLKLEGILWYNRKTCVIQDYGGFQDVSKISNIIEYFRYMVAARDIKPGELIFTEEPLGLGPNHSTLPCCLDCMKQVLNQKEQYAFNW